MRCSSLSHRNVLPDEVYLKNPITSAVMPFEVQAVNETS
jgi:hypothetical protein